MNKEKWWKEQCARSMKEVVRELICKWNRLSGMENDRVCEEYEKGDKESDLLCELRWW